MPVARLRRRLVGAFMRYVPWSKTIEKTSTDSAGLSDESTVTLIPGVPVQDDTTELDKQIADILSYLRHDREHRDESRREDLAAIDALRTRVSGLDEETMRLAEKTRDISVGTVRLQVVGLFLIIVGTALTMVAG
jgi:hypothetical protein